MARRPEFRGFFLWSAAISWLAKDVAGATWWLDVVREIATSYLHASTLGGERQWTGFLNCHQGDWRRALSCGQEAHDVYLRIGNLKNVGRALTYAGFALLELGDIHSARARFSQSLEHARATGVRWLLAWSHFGMGITSLCRHEWDDATDAFERVAADRFRYGLG